MSNIKIIEVRHQGEHIATIEGDWCSLRAYRRNWPLPAIYRYGVDEVVLGVFDADRLTRASMIRLMRDAIERDMFPLVRKLRREPIEYGRAVVYAEEEWFGL